MKLPPLIVFTVSRNRQSYQNLSQAPGPGGGVPELDLKTRETGIPYDNTLFAAFG
jgi:hypothetical protein